MKTKIASLTAILGAVTAAQAATLVYEGFNYTAGQNAVDNSFNGGFGWAEPWRRAQDGGRRQDHRLQRGSDRTFRAPGTVPTVPKAFLRAKITEAP